MRRCRRHLLLHLDGHRARGDRRLRPGADRARRRLRRARRLDRPAGPRRCALASRHATDASSQRPRADVARVRASDGRPGRHRRPARAPPRRRREPALGGDRRALPRLHELHAGLPDLLLHERRRQRSDLAGRGRPPSASWDSCFTLDFARVAGGNFRPRVAGPLPPVADPQVRHLDGAVRHVRLRRLRPLHHLVPGRHRRSRRADGRGPPTRRSASLRDAARRRQPCQHAPRRRRGAPSQPPPCRGSTGDSVVPTETRRETLDVVTLRLRTDDPPCSPASPGQFVMAALPGRSPRRPSPSRASTTTALELTIRAAGAATGAHLLARARRHARRCADRWAAAGRSSGADGAT